MFVDLLVKGDLALMKEVRVDLTEEVSFSITNPEFIVIFLVLARIGLQKQCL